MHEYAAIVVTLIREAQRYPKFRLGDLAVHKTLYFFNQSSEIYRFTWGDRGPYSGEVQQILHDLQARGWISKGQFGRCTIDGCQVPDMDETANHYYYAGRKNPPEISTELLQSVRDALKFTASKTVIEMELLSSAHKLLSHDYMPLDRQSRANYLEARIDKFTRQELDWAVGETMKDGAPYPV